MNELRDEIAKLSKKIEVLRQDPEGDKQELKGLYEKRRALHAQYHDHKTMQVGEKVSSQDILVLKRVYRKDTVKLYRIFCTQLILYAVL